MEKDRAKDLFTGHRENNLDPRDRAILDSWYLSVANQEPAPSSLDIERRLDRLWHKLPVNRAIRRERRVFFLKWGAAAAVLLMVLTVGLYTNRGNKDEHIIAGKGHYANDVLPGGNRATLILSDGREVLLDEKSIGSTIEEEGIKIIKNADGSIAYQPEAEKTATTSAINSISTPRAGQYRVRLPDGSTVWLNAQSSLRYPTRFNSDERRVEMTGEAYFEIAKDKDRPFVVVSREQEIKVLGTHFNVNSYENEKHVRTTLLEGSIRLSAGNRQMTLSPGERAELTDAGYAIEHTSGESDLAWKNGRFDFDNADIQVIMRQLERWYDVKVSFKGNPSTDHFRGKISRTVRLSQVLKILEAGGIKFDIQEDRIVVHP